MNMDVKNDPTGHLISEIMTLVDSDELTQPFSEFMIIGTYVYQTPYPFLSLSLF